MTPRWTSLWLLLLGFASCQRPLPNDAGTESVPAPSQATVDPTSAAIDRIVVAAPTDMAPVQGAAGIVPSRMSPGGSATLVVRLRIAPGWHLYAADALGGPNQPTRLETTLPAGCSAVGEWESPAAAPLVTSQGVTAIYQTEAVFRQSLQFAASIPLGETAIVCDVHYQACDARRCLRPERLTLQVPVHLVTERD